MKSNNELAKMIVDLGARSYDILIEAGLLAKAGELTAAVRPEPALAVIITNPAVARLYGDTVMCGLKAVGLQSEIIKVPAGERAKSLTTANKIYGRLLELGADRHTVVVALGGGVIGDLAGFVAATYMRGIQLVQIPTTLLSQVDSSVGGKTAVNHRLAKNIIGAFYQPKLVIIDPLVLKTLPARELRTGVGEVIKYALIGGEPLLSKVKKALPLNLKMVDPTEIIFDCCRYKADVVIEDELDLGRRAVLNYGHTIGHAIEAVAGYGRYNHGEAVAIGMIGAARIAESMGWLKPADVKIHQAMIDAAGLPSDIARLDAAAIYAHLRHDKKRERGGDRFVLLKGIGRPVVETVDSSLIKKTIAGLRSDRARA